MDDGRAGLGLAALPAQQRAEPVVSSGDLARGTAGCGRSGSWPWLGKLLIALWKYLETGEVPAGAELVKKKKVRVVKLKRRRDLEGPRSEGP